jgi:hypothetical protein
MFQPAHGDGKEIFKKEAGNCADRPASRTRRTLCIHRKQMTPRATAKAASAASRIRLARLVAASVFIDQEVLLAASNPKSNGR